MKHQSEIAVLRYSVITTIWKLFLCVLNSIKEIYDNTSAEFGCPFRLPVSHFSSKANSNKLTSALVSKIKYLNQKYERYLERNFPRFYQLYSTFLKGGFSFKSTVYNLKRQPRNICLNVGSMQNVLNWKYPVSGLKWIAPMEGCLTELLWNEMGGK